MKLHLDWLRDFPTTQALAFAAGCLIVVMSLVSIVKWDSPPEGLAIFLGSLAGISVAQFAIKRTTDDRYVQAKAAGNAAAATAARARGAAQSPRVTTTTEPEGTTTTVVEPPPEMGGVG